MAGDKGPRLARNLLALPAMQYRLDTGPCNIATR